MQTCRTQAHTQTQADVSSHIRTQTDAISCSRWMHSKLHPLFGQMLAQDAYIWMLHIPSGGTTCKPWCQGFCWLILGTKKATGPSSKIDKRNNEMDTQYNLCCDLRRPPWTSTPVDAPSLVKSFQEVRNPNPGTPDMLYTRQLHWSLMTLVTQVQNPLFCVRTEHHHHCHW